MKTVLEKNQKYLGDIQLNVIESLSPNDLIIKKLSDSGFTDVMVTGKGKQRTATGLWPGETREVEIPSQVKSIKKI